MEYQIREIRREEYSVLLTLLRDGGYKRASLSVQKANYACMFEGQWDTDQ